MKYITYIYIITYKCKMKLVTVLKYILLKEQTVLDEVIDQDEVITPSSNPTEVTNLKSFHAMLSHLF